MNLFISKAADQNGYLMAPFATVVKNAYVRRFINEAVASSKYVGLNREKRPGKIY